MGNIGNVGEIIGIYIAENSKGSVAAIRQARLEAGKGIVGDRYHTAAEHQVAAGNAVAENHLTLIATEELDKFMEKHQCQMDYGAFRRNIITSGIDLNGLVGKEFWVGNALCFGCELCEPCATLAATVHRAVLPDLVHRAGLRATIVKDGAVAVGGKISE